MIAASEDRQKLISEAEHLRQEEHGPIAIQKMLAATTEGRQLTEAELFSLAIGDPVEQGWTANPRPPGPPEPETLPVDALPPGLRDHAAAVAACTQTPVDMSMMMALAAVSAALRGRLAVSAAEGRWVEPANFYTATILESGARKSAANEAHTRELEEFDAEQALEWEPRRLAALDVVDVRERELERARKDAASGSGEGGLPAVEYARMRLEAAKADVPVIPRLVVSDITPERLVQEMAEQGGAIALIAPEGDPLRIMDGRYSKDGKPQLDELKRAWSGETIRVDRKSNRTSIIVPRPALTICIALQPGVLESLHNRGAFKSEGVFARFLWVAPDARIGFRLTGRAVPRPDREAAARYAGILRTILRATLHNPDRHILQLSDGALEEFYAFHEEAEHGLRPGGALFHIREWGSKAHGQALRLAALLEVAARAEDGRQLWTDPIGPWAMRSAVRLMRALATHAARVLAELPSSGNLTLQGHVLRRIKELPEGTSVHDLHQHVKGRSGLETLAELEQVLDALQGRGCIRVVAPSPSGRGRPPSPRIDLHPYIRVPKIPENHASDSQRRISRNFENGNGAVQLDPTAERLFDGVEP